MQKEEKVRLLDYLEIGDDETWELFARDFFAEQGFIVESEPGRGADGGKDLIISEQLRGKLRSEKFTWLVSCKYFSQSGRSVGMSDETAILDRLRQHKCDGFIGFYSTISSSPLIERLSQLRENGDILEYRIFDCKKIESQFLALGFSRLAARYFPLSYVRFRPIQQYLSEYAGLRCEVCGTDILLANVQSPHAGRVLFGIKYEDNIQQTESIHFCCSGKCDEVLSQRMNRKGLTDAWKGLEDLTNPAGFLQAMIAYMNQLKDADYIISDEAHEKIKELFIALSQRTLRELSEEDRKRFSIDMFWTEQGF